MADEKLKTTPLHPVYSGRPGVKLVNFGGWEMPVQFAGGILAEHNAVRSSAGIFDVSHMGEILVAGSGAEAFLDGLVTNAVAGAETGKCIYTPMCREDGGTVDDLLIYVLADDSFLLVVNAANTLKDFSWISGQAKGVQKLTVRDVSAEWAQVALQGPDSAAVLRGLTGGFDPAALPYYRHAGMIEAGGVRVLLSRTGYTGEDGFELYCSAGDAPVIWKALEDAGAVPCGLGARDILRLEARLPLYGHELTDEINPLEAGLGMFVKTEGRVFPGRKVLAGIREKGADRRLYGLEMIDPGVARQGYPVFAGEKLLGQVTSGGKSPVRESFIALALLETGTVDVGDSVDVEIHGKRRAARVVKTPFYRRKPSPVV